MRQQYVTLGVPRGPLNIPYSVAGLLDICASGKMVTVSNRLLFYYKYDSRAVDCVKVFKSSNAKSLGFRFIQVIDSRSQQELSPLQINFYEATNKLGRGDALFVYEDESFSKTSQIGHFTANSRFEQAILPTRSTTMAFHLRATAADGDHGFIAEVCKSIRAVYLFNQSIYAKIRLDSHSSFNAHWQKCRRSNHPKHPDRRER